MSQSVDKFLDNPCPRFEYREPREQPQRGVRVTATMTDLDEASAHAAEQVAHLPDGDAKELLRLSHECGYLRGTVASRNLELRTLRERIREMDAREIERLDGQ